MGSIDKQRYAFIKRCAYTVFLLENPNGDQDSVDCSEQKQIILNNLNDQEKQIFLNTIKCPYDIDLYDSLFKNKLSKECIEKTCDFFGIDEELLLQKSREYLEYSYLKLTHSFCDEKFSNYAMEISNSWNHKTRK